MAVAEKGDTSSAVVSLYNSVTLELRGNWSKFTRAAGSEPHATAEEPPLRFLVKSPRDYTVNKGGNVVKARLAQGTQNPAQGLRSLCSQCANPGPGRAACHPIEVRISKLSCRRIRVLVDFYTEHSRQ